MSVLIGDISWKRKKIPIYTKNDILCMLPADINEIIGENIVSGGGKNGNSLLNIESVVAMLCVCKNNKARDLGTYIAASGSKAAKKLEIEYMKAADHEREKSLEEEILSLKQRIKDIEAGKEDVIYILNFYPYDDGVYKIGFTDNINRRVGDMNTGTPSEIKVEHCIPCSNKRICEGTVHHILANYRINPRKEFFMVDLEYAKTICDRVVDFIDSTRRYADDRKKLSAGNTEHPVRAGGGANKKKPSGGNKPQPGNKKQQNGNKKPTDNKEAKPWRWFN